jgi:hypothetical protein
MGDAFTWTNTGTGDWGTASNWFDVTAGTPASTPPGPADTAEIDNPGTGNITVTGPADVAGLSVSGQVTLAGSYTVGSFVLGVPPFNPSFFGPTLTSTIALAGNFNASSLSIGDLHLVPGFSSFQVADYGIVEVDQGAILSAGTVTLNAGDLQVDGGAVSFANDLTLGTDLFPDPFVNAVNLTTGSLDVTNHGSVQLGGLAITDGSVNLDATSTLEIGDAGTATAGTITIDPGAVLTEGDGSAYLILAVRNAETVTVSSPLLNNGTIYSAFDVSNVINNGVIFANNATARLISGDGLLDLENAGTIGPGVSGTLDFSESPSIVFDLGTGVPVDTADTPRIVNFITTGGFFGPTSDTIVLDGISADTATYTITGPGIGTLALYDDGITPVASLTMLGTYASDAFAVAPGSGDSVVSLNLPCFAAGTRIATPRGQVAVEALSPGDEVTLASGATAPIVWIGRRRVDCRSHPKPAGVWPVRIGRDAFAPGVPHRDLFLSPDHAVFAENVLIPIKYLMNGDTIRQVARKSIEYFHVELSRHDVLLADGLPVESYLDTGDRGSFENGGRVVALFPAFSPFAWDANGCAPLVVTGPPVAAVRRRIERQARHRHGLPHQRKRRSTA